MGTEARMLTVDDYAKIRLAHRDGMSIREIARTFHHSRQKIREILAKPHPNPYTRTKPPPAPVLGTFTPIDAILAADEEAPPKQRHTAMQVFRGCAASMATRAATTRFAATSSRHRRDHRETFIPLAHDPGQRLEADFGHIYVDFPDGRRLVPVLVAAWAYSNYAFALALPTERTEAILAGMVEAFAFFGCVPHEVWWDNPKTVVRQIFKGRERTPNDYYPALASHYTFEALSACRRAATRSRTRKRGCGCCNGSGPRPCRGCGPGRLERPLAAMRGGGKARTVPGTRSRSASVSPATAPGRCRCRRIGSIRACSSRRRWTSTRRCSSTATATACRGRAPSGR